MAKGPRDRVPFRRRRENRTNYRVRKALLKSDLPRAIVRKTNRHIRIQVANFHLKGDEIVASAYSGTLTSYGWQGNLDNNPAAYLTGLIAGKRCLEAGIEEVILDIGRHVPTKGSVVFAAMKGLLDAGVKIPHDDAVVPDEERIAGKHLSESIQAKFAEIRDKLQEGGEEASDNG